MSGPERSQGKEAEWHASQLAALQDQMEEDKKYFAACTSELMVVRQEIEQEKKSSTEAHEKVSVLECNREKEADEYTP